MKKLTLVVSLFLSFNCMAQKKLDSPLIKKVVSDTVVVVQFTVKEFNAFMSWMDGLRCVSNGEIKDADKFIYDRVKIIKK